MTKVRIFLIPLSITFLNSKIVGFFFFLELDCLTWEVKSKKLTDFRKSTKDEGDYATGLTSPPNYAIIWTETS